MIPELAEGITNAVNALEGWTSPARCIEMADLLMDNRCKRYVELGVFGGRTLITAAIAMRQMNEGGIAVGIDPWRKEACLEGESGENADWWSKVDLEAIHRGCMNAVWAHLIEPWCAVIRSRSEHVAQLFNRIDAILIDGNHSEVASTRDVELWLPRVMTGGLIFMDDCDWTSTKKAQSIVEKEATCFHTGDGGHYRIFKKL